MSNPIPYYLALFLLLCAILIVPQILDLIHGEQNKNIPVEEISCKSIENTGRFGSAEYYIFDLEGHRHKVFQEDWDKFDVPTCP